MTEDLPTSDMEREKLRKQLLAEMNSDGSPDFTRPMIVVNLDAFLNGKTAHPLKIPPAMLAAAGWPVQKWILNLHKFYPIENATTPEERERYYRGEPILIRANVVGLRPKRSSGGQAKDDIEKHINDAFAVSCFVIFERLRHLIPLRDGKNVRNWLNQEAAKDFIFKRELLPLPWPEHDHRTTDKDRLGLMDTAWRNGQRPKLLRRLYPYSPDQLRKKIVAWAKSFCEKRRQEIEEEIRFLKTQFASLNLCRERAREFRRIENEISKFMQQHQDDETYPDPTHAQVAAGFNRLVEAGDIFPAVYAGDFDPRPIFLRLASVKSFEFIRYLGRAARGHDTKLSPRIFSVLIANSRRALMEKPELFAERRYPDLMSGREFLLHAYAAYERQRAANDNEPDAIRAIV